MYILFYLNCYTEHAIFYIYYVSVISIVTTIDTTITNKWLLINNRRDSINMFIFNNVLIIANHLILLSIFFDSLSFDN